MKLLAIIAIFFTSCAAVPNRADINKMRAGMVQDYVVREGKLKPVGKPYHITQDTIKLFLIQP
jgi:hypothetical protein